MYHIDSQVWRVCPPVLWSRTFACPSQLIFKAFLCRLHNRLFIVSFFRNCLHTTHAIHHSSPYTFFLLNGDIELHRNWQILVSKMLQHPQSSLEKTSITAFPTMNALSPALLCT